MQNKNLWVDDNPLKNGFLTKQPTKQSTLNCCPKPPSYQSTFLKKPSSFKPMDKKSITQILLKKDIYYTKKTLSTPTNEKNTLQQSFKKKNNGHNRFYSESTPGNTHHIGPLLKKKDNIIFTYPQEDQLTIQSDISRIPLKSHQSLPVLYSAFAKQQTSKEFPQKTYPLQSLTMVQTPIKNTYRKQKNFSTQQTFHEQLNSSQASSKIFKQSGLVKKFLPKNYFQTSRSSQASIFDQTESKKGKNDDSIKIKVSQQKQKLAVPTFMRTIKQYKYEQSHSKDPHNSVLDNFVRNVKPLDSQYSQSSRQSQVIQDSHAYLTRMNSRRISSYETSFQ